MESRRDFLRVSAVTTTAALGGCVRGIADKVSSGNAWPPAKPSKIPDQNEVPDLPPPTWGESNLPHVFIYNDLATREAGKLFNNRWESIRQLIQENRVQVSFCDYPLPWNEWSLPVAISARSVQYHAGRDSFLNFLQRVLRDYMPEPYFTKQRILDAAETVGAPRDAVKEDTESWRFYSIVRNSKRRGQKMGIKDSVPLAVIVNQNHHSRPFQPTSGRIKIMMNKLAQ